jgi:hypothetical protein
MDDPIEAEKKKLQAELETELSVSSAWQPERWLKVWRGEYPLGEYQFVALKANMPEVKRVIRELLASIPPDA